MHTSTKESALKKPIQFVKGVGPKLAAEFRKMGVLTVGDLLYHVPRRYLDMSVRMPIGDLVEGAEVTVVGDVVNIRRMLTRRRFKVLNVTIADGTGFLTAVWFNQDWRTAEFSEGAKVAFSGRVEFKYGDLQMANPFYDFLEDGKTAPERIRTTNRILPLHPATQNLSSARIRLIVQNAIDDAGVLEDPVPAKIKADQGLIEYEAAIREVHFPTSQDKLALAKHRLIFHELLLLQTGLAYRKKRLEGQVKAVRHTTDGALFMKWRETLDFKLTGAQERVLDEILQDMASEKLMNRLLQGDVGSGKTVVAAGAMAACAAGGYQSALMVPTEVLAEQHHAKLSGKFAELGIESVLLTSSIGTGEKRDCLQKIKEGRAMITIGTHAVIQEAVEFASLGLAIIDEQHRFGVHQRVALKSKGAYPDLLVMTATPIPRTLAMTFYGDLESSVIDEMPQGRKPITTVLVDRAKRAKAYKFIRQEIAKGRQAYVVCSVIDESKMDLRAVNEEYERLKTTVFHDLNVALLHGRMPAQDKDAIMKAFRANELQVLVATTVIEVGIDVTNATIMMIEDADRFGLSQLHQLRGRIGRGEHESFCLLFADPKTDEAIARLKAIISITDGFELAEKDLEIRGEGQIMGVRQSGLPDLRIAQITRDQAVLSQARETAFSIIEADPELTSVQNAGLRAAVEDTFADRLDWLFVS